MFIESKRITYNGRSSSEFGLLFATTSGNRSYNVGYNSEILYEKVKNIDTVFYYGREKKPLEFELELYKETVWSVTDRKNIMNWLLSDSNFHDLVFENPNCEDLNVCSTEFEYRTNDIVFNCIPTGEITAMDFGGLYGIKFKMLCSKPYATTDVISQYFDLSTNTGIVEKDVMNFSNIEDYLTDIDIEFTLKSDSTGITLTNLSDNGYIFQFSGLNTSETIGVSGSRCEIVSSTGLNRLSKMSLPNDGTGGFFRLNYGLNKIQILGKCELEIRARFPLAI